MIKKLYWEWIMRCNLMWKKSKVYYFGALIISIGLAGFISDIIMLIAGMNNRIVGYLIHVLFVFLLFYKSYDFIEKDERKK